MVPKYEPAMPEMLPIPMAGTTVFNESVTPQPENDETKNKDQEDCNKCNNFELRIS
jgi:hypothetical protein